MHERVLHYIIDETVDNYQPPTNTTFHLRSNTYIPILAVNW